jgi:gamma-glutamyltranspeptidase/glutathione hydrolase
MYFNEYYFGGRKMNIVLKRVLYLFLFTITLTLSVGQIQEGIKQSNYAESSEGMVATAHPLASKAAYDILKMGGNAVDAAVAAAFAIGVVEPNASGLGGGGGMVIYLQNEKKTIYINYYAKASEKIDELHFNPDYDKKTPKAILVPGTVAGLTKALELYGTLPLSTVLQPAIKYAEEGFPVDKTLASLILDNVKHLQKYETTSNIYLPEGFPLMEGEIVYQPDLAATLRIISEKGEKGFYEGAVAEQIVKDVTNAGGKLTLEDLKSYKPVISTPVQGTYRGYKIISAGLPQSGASVIQSLNMLEQKNLRSMGHFKDNAETLHLMAETFRRVYADRSAYIADPKFVDVPLSGLISKKYAQARFKEIDMNNATPPEYRKTKKGNPIVFNLTDKLEETVSKENDSGDFFGDDVEDEAYTSQQRNENLFDSWGRVRKASKKETKKESKAPVKQKEKNLNEFEEESDAHTTHLSIIDKDGNIVSLTQTIGTFFGSGLISAGVLLNCSISNYSFITALNKVKPSKQPRSAISPTIVLKDDKPFLVVGSPGGNRIISTVVQIIVNVIDFDMNVIEANEAPRIFCQKDDDYLHIENRISDEVQADLKKKGHNLRVYGEYDLFFGGVQMILIDSEKSMFFGSADVRRGGSALGL